MISIIATWRAGTTSAPTIASAVGQALQLDGRRSARTAPHAACTRPARRQRSCRRRAAARDSSLPSSRHMPAASLQWVWPTEHPAAPAPGAGRRHTPRRARGPRRFAPLGRAGGVHRQRHSRLRQSHHHQTWRESGSPPMRTIANRWCARARRCPAGELIAHMGEGAPQQAGAVFRNSPQRQASRSAAISSAIK